MKNKTSIRPGHSGPPANRLVPARRERTAEQIDNHRRPVWLEATESFYKKLNRVAKQCDLSRYEALSKGLDALTRETQVKNSALNRNVKSPGQSEVFRRTMGQVSRNYWARSAWKRNANEREKVRKRDGTDILERGDRSARYWRWPSRTPALAPRLGPPRRGAHLRLDSAFGQNDH
jgi:hypothetical protein